MTNRTKSFSAVIGGAFIGAVLIMPLVFNVLPPIIEKTESGKILSVISIGNKRLEIKIYDYTTEQVRFIELNYYEELKWFRDKKEDDVHTIKYKKRNYTNICWDLEIHVNLMPDSDFALKVCNID